MGSRCRVGSPSMDAVAGGSGCWARRAFAGEWKGGEVMGMAKNTGKGYREGAVRDRSQLRTPAGWTKRDDETGRFMDVKSDGEPFKGVRREHSDEKK